MDLEQFVKVVEQEGGLSPETAETATRAVFAALSARLPRGQTRDLIRELPGSGPWLYHEGDAEPFDYDEFLRRVADRAGTDHDTAERYARVVFAALGRALTADELADLVGALPQSFAPVLAEAQRQIDHTPPAGEFVSKVADRAGIDAGAAERAVAAVLETLAERISGGEVDDLISALPVALHPPLKRGKEATGGRPRKLPRDKFLLRVAEREDVPPDVAYEHARVVFEVLRDELPGEAFWDVVVQLPPDYGVLLPVRHEL